MGGGRREGLTLVQGAQHLLQLVVDVGVQLVSVLVHVLQVCLHSSHLGSQAFAISL